MGMHRAQSPQRRLLRTRTRHFLARPGRHGKRRPNEDSASGKKIERGRVPQRELFVLGMEGGNCQGK